MTHRCTNAVAKTRAHQVRWTSRCWEPERRRWRGESGTTGRGGGAEAGPGSGGAAASVERYGGQLRRAAPDLSWYRFAERRKSHHQRKLHRRRHALLRSEKS